MFQLALKNAFIILPIILLVHFLIKGMISDRPKHKQEFESFEDPIVCSPKKVVEEETIEACNLSKVLNDFVEAEEDSRENVADVQIACKDTIVEEDNSNTISDLDEMFMKQSLIERKRTCSKSTSLDEVFEHVFNSNTKSNKSVGEVEKEKCNDNLSALYNNMYVVNTYDNEKGINGGTIMGDLVGYDGMISSYATL